MLSKAMFRTLERLEQEAKNKQERAGAMKQLFNPRPGSVTTKLSQL
jgi:hypothetical protein